MGSVNNVHLLMHIPQHNFRNSGIKLVHHIKHDTFKAMLR